MRSILLAAAIGLLLTACSSRLNLMEHSMLVTPRPNALFSAAERESLKTRVESFDAAMRGEDFEAVIGMTPRKIHEAMAARMGLSLEQYQAVITQQMAQVLSIAEVESFRMDLTSATGHRAPSGRRYMLLPTRTVIIRDGVKMRAETQTLAFLEDGMWCLTRITRPEHLAILAEVYPEFAGIEVPPGRMTTLD